MFFFKQKTAYEMRISDWSSDVCSSDLAPLFNNACINLGERALVDLCYCIRVNRYGSKMAASMVATWLSKSSAAFSISPSPLYGPVPGPCVVVEAAAVPLPSAGPLARPFTPEPPSPPPPHFHSPFQK